MTWNWRFSIHNLSLAGGAVTLLATHTIAPAFEPANPPIAPLFAWASTEQDPDWDEVHPHVGEIDLETELLDFSVRVASGAQIAGATLEANGSKSERVRAQQRRCGFEACASWVKESQVSLAGRGSRYLQAKSNRKWIRRWQPRRS